MVGEQQQEQLHLHVVTGSMQGTVAVFPIKKKVTIGRTRVNAFPIKHDTVSQRHAFIVFKSGQWFVTDSGSSNGTFINGVSISPGVPTELRNGDRLGIGPENDVSVKIRNAKDDEEQGLHVGVGVGVGVEEEEEEEEERRQQQQLRGQRLTLKEWVEHEKDHLEKESESTATSYVREMVDHAEALKKEIFEAAGLEYPSIP